MNSQEDKSIVCCEGNINTYFFLAFSRRASDIFLILFCKMEKFWSYSNCLSRLHFSSVRNAKESHEENVHRAIHIISWDLWATSTPPRSPCLKTVIKWLFNRENSHLCPADLCPNSLFWKGSSWSFALCHFCVSCLSPCVLLTYA